MIAVTADIHADNWQQFSTVMDDGRNSRLVAILNAVRWTAKDALDRGCEFFCVAGDLFHNRKFIEVAVLSEVSNLIDELSRMFTFVYILRGNHDESITRRENSVGAFKRGNVEVIDRPCVRVLGNKRVGFIPWVGPSRATFTKKLKQIKKVDGVITHAALDKAWAGASDWEVEGDLRVTDLMKGRQKWVLMGHFHKSQSWEDGDKLIAYVGSPIQHTMNERTERKGYWVVPRRGKPFMVYNDEAPRFHEVKTAKDVKLVRPHDYVKTVGENANKLKKKVAKRTPHVVALPPPKLDTKLRLPPQREGAHKIVKSFVKAHGVPEGIDPSDATDIGMYILSLKES